MKASISNYRQSPRKVRLAADLIRGKNVNRALLILDTTNKRANHQIKKLIKMAVSNSGKKADGLMVKAVRIDDGITLKRIRPVARGAAHPIRKRTSHIYVELAPAKEKKTSEKPKKKATTNKMSAKKTTKKANKKTTKRKK